MGQLETVLQAVERACEHDHADVQRAVDCLHDLVDRYFWVGIYVVDGDELVLGPWRGPEATEHVRIPIGQGICGAAAASGQTEIVDDVNADPRYLACFPSTRSEIVVPIHFGGAVIGEIDIDSDRPSAFGPEDRDFLERVAALIAPSMHATRDSSASRPSFAGLSVADVMLATPKTLPAATTVADARLALENDHVQMLLLADGIRFLGAVTSIPEDAGPSDPALEYVDAATDTIDPDESADAAYERADASPHRRLVVLGEDDELLGLVCLNVRRSGFCSSGSRTPAA